MAQQKLLLTGPTAVGKTSVSLELAEKLNAEIISSDSRQCYKYLNIGTATPTADELNQVRHYNISIIGPAVKDSAVNFYERCQQWENEIKNRGKTVLYTGGSTLHQKIIIQPFDELPSSDASNIKKLEQRINKNGIESLYKKLQQVDPAYADKMDGMNPQRIIRALDVWMQTGKPFSSFHSNKPLKPPADLTVVGLKRDRQKLYERINRRVDFMFKNGFIDEVKSILEMGYRKDDPGLNTVGYKQVIDFLNDNISKERMVSDIKAKTRQYAKRQLTWFKRWDFVHWIQIDGKTPEEISKKISDIFL
ncbi:MAG TPA: tRNA (adenosine(37)-N6)-dimethylallyltransferase MiaA [Balneolaceae bacterium]|nr:tRNA (adenosine(37)-N6)-dimethylallyltransferase MiaA [Balneolaceae bacterium]